MNWAQAGPISADLGATPSGRLHEEVDLLRGQVGSQRATLARASGAMGGDQRVVMEELDLAEGGADPEARADQAMRAGVVGAGEDDVAVAMELGALPLDRLPGHERQGQQGGALELVEQLQRRALGRAVDPPASSLHTPAEQVAIAVVQTAEGAAGERVALDVVDAALFHLPFMFGGPRATGRDEKAVVLGALAVAAPDLGIVKRGPDNRGAEIIEDHTAGDAGEKLEGGAVQAQPGLDRLVEHELGVLMPTERQRHHEHPRAADATALRIEELTGEAEVDLRFFAWRHFDPQRGHARERRHAPQEALHRGVAAGEAVFLDQELPDGLPLDAALVQGEDALAPRLDDFLSNLYEHL